MASLSWTFWQLRRNSELRGGIRTEALCVRKKAKGAFNVDGEFYSFYSYLATMNVLPFRRTSILWFSVWLTVMDVYLLENSYSWDTQGTKMPLNCWGSTAIWLIPTSWNYPVEVRFGSRSTSIRQGYSGHSRRTMSARNNHSKNLLQDFTRRHPCSQLWMSGNKEAADAKIKECLRVFARFPQTLKVFFGG